MPELEFAKIISVSSEEKNFLAEHLLKCGEFKKWKCSPGESKAVVIFQLKEASKIEKIHIGNEGSAFVEVFVGKSSMKEVDFQVILVASSFMTPVESRNGQNLNKVRFFDKDHLSKAALDQKWDMVKVVCTQPFNKNIPYGLSFITLHSPPSAEDVSKDGFGAFSLKSEPEKTSSFKVGSLFERSKQKQSEAPSISVAASIRDVSIKQLKEEEGEMSSSKHAKEVKEIKTSDLNKQGPSNKTSDLNKQGPLNKTSDLNKQGPSNKTSDLNKQGPSNKTSSQSLKTKAPVDDSDRPPIKKFHGESSKESKKVEFNCLMKDVVFVLSGFKNPLRGQLRDKALAMGAKYKADWDESCTHLICAFDNTPKYNQVKGLGMIVKNEWIIDSYDKKELLPWRSYRLGRAPSPKKVKKSSSMDISDENITQKHNNEKIQDDDIFDAPTDSECEMNEDDDKVESFSTKMKNGISPCDLIGDLPELPDFFEGLRFMLYGDFTPEDRRCIKRHIVAYNGCLVEYMDNDVNVVITCESWDTNFDQALEENPRLIFIMPDWLIDCVQQQKKIPFKNYQLFAKE